MDLPIEPGPVPGRYDANVPVALRSKFCGKKTLSGTPLKAVEISETFQFQSTFFFTNEVAFL